VTSIGKQEFDFLVQRDGRPRYAYGTDQDSEPAVLEYVEETGSWRSMLGPDKPAFQPLALSADDREVYGRMFRKDGPAVLVRRRLPDGEPVMLAQDAVGSIDTFEWGPRPSIPFAAATGVGIPQPVYFDAQRPEAALHKALAAQFPGSYVHFINYSNDGSKLLFSVVSDRDPGAYYLFDRTANKAFLLFGVSPWIDPAKMAAHRPIHFTASDGLEIHGYLTLPASAGDAKPPLILLPHGGPHGVADQWFFDRDVQFLASRGYAVLQVNYRGSGGRGPDFQKAGYRQWGGRVQQDLLDGVRWAAAQGSVDARRICAYGGSFGAYSAMMAAIRAPGLFKCAVGYAGLYDLPLWYRTDETVESRLLYNYLVKVIGQDSAELVDNSPDRLVENLSVPVLLVHGSEDRRTPPQQFKAMRDALTKAGRPPDTLYVDGEGHGFYTEQNRQAFYEKLEAFLAKHLAP
jgi:dipeptidyl aminopeptidase/acylaminoacyl peptidase